MAETVTPGVTQMLATTDACPEIVVSGKPWKVGHPTQAAKARLEKLAARVALDEVRRLKDVLDPAAYSETFSEATRSLPEYRTWRPGWQRVVFDPANVHLFLLSLVQEHHPNATETDIIALSRAAPEEVTAALAQVIPDFFRLLLAGLEMTPDQRAAVEAELAKFRARLVPTPPTASP